MLPVDLRNAKFSSTAVDQFTHLLSSLRSIGATQYSLITAEDMSPVLGCYGHPDAITPNLDRLARQSVRYSHAFASAPVCSPSRSCLIQGSYPTSLGTQQMRSGFPLPAYMRGFPTILRQSGYFTTNNVKTDYNSGNYKEIIASSWNENSDKAHWRLNSDSSKPFFSVFNLMTSHQSRTMVWPYERFEEEIQIKLSKEEIHDPDEITLPPIIRILRSSVNPLPGSMTVSLQWIRKSVKF